MKAFLTWVQDDQKQGWDILTFLRIIKCLVSREYSFTIPLILKSDWLLHLPYITFLESNVTVIRIKEMITNLKSSCLSNKFSLYHHRKCKEKSVEIRIMKLGCKRWSPSHLCSAGVPQQKTDFSIGLYLSLNFVCFGSFVFTSEAFEENKNKKKTLFTLVLRVAMSLILARVTGLARELHSCGSTSLQLLWDCSTPIAGKVFVYQSSMHEYLKIKANEITSPIGNQNKDKYFENLCWNYHQNQGSEVHV